VDLGSLPEVSLTQGGRLADSNRESLRTLHDQGGRPNSQLLFPLNDVVREKGYVRTVHRRCKWY